MKRPVFNWFFDGLMVIAFAGFLIGIISQALGYASSTTAGWGVYLGAIVIAMIGVFVEMVRWTMSVKPFLEDRKN